MFLSLLIKQNIKIIAEKYDTHIHFFFWKSFRFLTQTILMRNNCHHSYLSTRSWCDVGTESERVTTAASATCCTDKESPEDFLSHVVQWLAFSKVTLILGSSQLLNRKCYWQLSTAAQLAKVWSISLLKVTLFIGKIISL